MSISLQKGQKVSLSKESAGLSNVLVGLGWDAVEQRSGLFGLFKAADIDCDATAILLKMVNLWIRQMLFISEILCTNQARSVIWEIT